MPRPFPGWGTAAGYHRHRKEKTIPCGACLAAWSKRKQARAQRGKCAPGLGWPIVPESQKDHKYR